ncbi:MAG: rhomboid family intramembrane serine protease [Paracoccaceae bacterium]
MLCCVPELALQGADWGLWGSARWRPLTYQNGAFWSGLLRGWQPNYAAQPYTMFVTYAFLHAGAGHLVVNMITLYTMGREIARRISQRHMLLIYGTSIFGGAAGYAILGPVVQPMVGASGALFGLAGSWVTWDVWGVLRINRTMKTFVYAITWPVLFLVGLNVIMYWAAEGQLAWETHLGGFLAGAIVAALLVACRRTSAERCPDEFTSQSD